MKVYELNTRDIQLSAFKDYTNYFELVYYNNFCKGYNQVKPAAWCSQNITSSGLNVVIQYLMNDNRATLEALTLSTNKETFRKQRLESSEVTTIGINI